MILFASLPKGKNKKLNPGSTRNRTEIAGIRIRSANHYTIEPMDDGLRLKPQGETQIQIYG